jgi:K+ transporter
MQNGVLLMGVASLALLLLTHGSVSALVVMYSINVFVTFSLSQFGMSRFYFTNRHVDHRWKRHIMIHLIGLALCLLILVAMIIIKFTEGGWITILITSVVIGFCIIIKRHYKGVRKELQGLDEALLNIPSVRHYNDKVVESGEMTAIQLVNSYNGFGVHTFLSIVKNFPGTYKNFIFVSVAVVDSGTFKGSIEMENLKKSVRESLEKYVELARRFGFAADYRMDVGTDVVESAVNLVASTVKEFPRSVVFLGQLTFSLEKFYHRFLHNETAFAIQRRLHWAGITSVILPIRVGIKRAA